MKVAGSAVLHASRDDVWRALNDPAVLVRTIPGCQRLEETGPDTYAMTVTAGVGAVKGTYAGQVQLCDQQVPASFVLRASGAGAPGTVSAEVAVTLSENGDGGTRLDYDADAIVGGMVGGVGQRMLTGVAKKTAGEFFAAVDDVLTGAVAPVGSPGEEPAGAPRGVEPGGAGVGVSPDSGERGVYVAPGAPSGPASAFKPDSDYAKGLLTGALIALAGVVVGGWIAGRRRT